jgi:hypothetical protein
MILSIKTIARQKKTQAVAPYIYIYIGLTVACLHWDDRILFEGYKR